MKRLLTVCMLLALVASAAFANYKKEDLQASQTAAIEEITLEKALAYYEAGLEMTPAMKDMVIDYLGLNDARGGAGSLDNVGGPDAFGYRWVDNQAGDSVVYQWIDLCNDPGASNSTGITDDSQQQVAIGFNFPYYGTNYTLVSIGSNGTLRLDGTLTSYSNVCVNVATEHNRVNVYWDDLNPSAATSLGCLGTPGAGTIKYKSFGTYFVVQWYRVDPYSGTGISSFQAILTQDGRIKVTFHEDPLLHSHSSVGATVGIEQLGATNGLQYSCNTAGIVAGRSIVFYPPLQAPSGRCCYLDSAGQGTCAELTTDECFALSGQWGGAGTTCTANPCPTGRCCYVINGQGACATNTQLECNALAGQWATGLNCDTPCPTGRCCYVDAFGGSQCETNIQLACTALNGVWSAGLSCTANPCPTPRQGSDLCVDAPLVTVPGTYAGTTVGATAETGIPACGSGYNATSIGVWYKVIGTGNTMTASLCDPLTVYDSEMFVFCGSCENLNCIDGDDDDCVTPGLASTITWCSQPGVEYYILVTAFGSASGTYALGLSDDGTPCSTAINCYPVGRCCYTEATGGPACADVTAAECEVLGGEFNAQATCESAPCYGSCCYVVDNEGFCNDQAACADHITAAACAELGGTWTAGGSCDGSVCPSGLPCVCRCDLYPNSHSEVAVDETTYPISEVFPTTTVIINVPIQYNITDLNVSLDLVHTFDGDLDIFLTSPLGTVIELSTDNGAGGDNFTCTTFDDEASVSVVGSLAPFTGSFIPETALSAVDNENALGNWLLTITDDAGGDVGYIIGVCLQFEYDRILPVAFGSFDAVVGSERVTLNWNTNSESNVSSFEVLRDGAKIAEVAAQNNATGANYTYTDVNLTNGVSYSYSLVSVDLNGDRATLATMSATPSGSAVISEYALHQNYPNPFNPTTNIAFDMVEAGKVTISVFNIMGQKVAEIVNGNMEAGRHVVTFDATSLSSGLYLTKMEANGFTAQSKMVLMK